MIKIGQEKCIGCGSCVAICPDCFEMDEENKAKIKEDVTCNGGCNKEVIDICPVDAIIEE